MKDIDFTTAATRSPKVPLTAPIVIAARKPADRPRAWLEPFPLDESEAVEDRVYWDDDAVQKRYSVFLGAESLTENGLREMKQFRENGLYFNAPPETVRLMSLLRNRYLPPSPRFANANLINHRLDTPPSHLVKAYDYFLQELDAFSDTDLHGFVDHCLRNANANLNTAGVTTIFLLEVIRERALIQYPELFNLSGADGKPREFAKHSINE